ncbi:peroxide stress protein YaaA, partial [Candidatus Enterovibrio escicola]
MLVVVSPAKSLDFKSPLATKRFTQPMLIKHAEALIEVCCKLTSADISDLMNVSDKIAGFNAIRFSEWDPKFTTENSRQAILAFKGDVYTSLKSETMSDADFSWAQNHLRILSGLYGLLRPLDLMQPYRLEMGTKLSNERGSNLYQFWGDIITNRLNEVILSQNDCILVNLASKEYFKVIKPMMLKAPVITLVFKDYNKGQYKVVSFFAKKARGMMARYIIDKRIDSVEGLKAFNRAGYEYYAEESSDKEIVFIRK